MVPVFVVLWFSSVERNTMTDALLTSRVSRVFFSNTRLVVRLVVLSVLVLAYILSGGSAAHASAEMGG